jgi:two-component sensor histidine kinase
MKNLRSLILPEYLLALPTFLSSLSIALFLHFIDYAHNVEGFYLLRFFIILSIHAILFGVIWAVISLLHKSMSPQNTVVFLIAAIYFASSIRGFSMYFGLDFFSVGAGVPFAFRMQSSLITIGTVILISTVTYALIITQSRANSDLLRTQSRLYEIRNRAVEEFSTFDEKFRGSIMSQLSSSIKNFSSAESVQALAILRSLINDVVRPLSAFLEKESARFNQELRPVEKFRINWLNVLTRSMQISEIKVLPPLLLLILFGSAPLTTDYSPIIALNIVVTILSLNLLVLILCKYIFQKISNRVRPPLRPLIFLLTIFIPGESVALQANYFIRNSDRPGAFTYIATGTFMFIAILLAILNATRAEVASVKAELNALTDELRWEAARAQELSRQQKRMLTFILHGQIQATMEASFLRLQNAISSDSGVEKIQSELSTNMSNSVDLLSASIRAPEPLNSLFEKVAVMWNEIAAIDCRVSEGMIKKIQSDPVCHVTISDLVTELTFNAVKHATATEILLEIAEGAARTITLSVTNNGSSYTETSRRGLGSKLLDDSTISWGRSSEAGKTITQCLLPIVEATN